MQDWDRVKTEREWVDMTYSSLAEGGLNYFPCRYGTSKLLFRGPRRRLDGRYVAVANYLPHTLVPAWGKLPQD